MHADRKRLDSRRVAAVLLDGLIFLPLWAVASQYDFGALAVVYALQLVYFYLCDTTGGQTLGKMALKLRTVTLDGEIVSPKAAAPRTVLRLIDHSVIGLIVMVASGGRRQRLGDLAAKTCVVDAREAEPAEQPLSRRHLLYPIGWVVPALIAVAMSADGKLSSDYRAKADALCAQYGQLAMRSQNLVQGRAVFAEMLARLEQLDPPRNWAERHEALLAEGATMLREYDGLVRVARHSGRSRRLKARVRRIDRIGRQVNARIRANGFVTCGDDAPA